MIVKKSVRRMGSSSLYVILPSAFAELCRIGAGDDVDLVMDPVRRPGEITIRKSSPADKKAGKKVLKKVAG